MFHAEFYPTPLSVLQIMGIDATGKVVLEPQAGKGDIVDFLKKGGASEVVAYEINKDLQKILTTKCRLIGDDFLEAKAEDISHVQLIVMNPPFSNADKHILHAYKIAPEGCEIISLCNYETINKNYRYPELSKLINGYGVSSSLGECFDTAERKTGVEVGLIQLFKPSVSEDNQFEGFFMEDDDFGPEGEGIMKYDEIRALVQRYIGAVKCFDRVDSVISELNNTLSPIGINGITLKMGYDENIVSREDFAKSIQKKSWAYIFGKMNLSKFVTSGVMKDINKFVEQQQKYPFTMKNIYRMFDIIVGTRQQTMNKALEEVIDNFTKYTHENRFGVEGWKTNSGYMLNKKFIVNYMFEPSYRDADKLDVKYNSHSERLDDLAKVLCNITGRNYSEMKTFYQYGRDIRIMRGQWHSWGFFEFKGFKKGTMHIKFQNHNDWYMLNKAYGELKGFTLSESYK